MAITAQAIVDRIQQKLGPGWKDPSVDTFLAGNRESDVKGVATTYAPSLEVLRKAVAAGKNMIISREAPFWTRNTVPGAGRGGAGGRGAAPGADAGAGRGAGAPAAANAAPARGGGRGQQTMESDPVFRTKRDYIAANNLIVYRFFDNWNARPQDGQLQGLAKALGWEQNYKPSGGQPWATNNGFFTIPPATLKATAQGIKTKLKMKSMRIAGDPETRVTKAALSHGLYLLADIRKLVAEPGVDLVIMGEPMWENEVAQYVFDIIASGQKKGMIVLGQAVSEDPGGGEMAAWLKSFVSEVPIEWIPTGEPCWMPY